MSAGWVGFDFDGTLVTYNSGDASKGEIGQPVWPMVAKARALLTRGIEVRIVTARVSGDNEEHVGRWRTRIEHWAIQHLGQMVKVTCSKDYSMMCLYDDRAIAVEHGTGRVLGGEEP